MKRGNIDEKIKIQYFFVFPNWQNLDIIPTVAVYILLIQLFEKLYFLVNYLTNSLLFELQMNSNQRIINFKKKSTP